MEEGVIGAVRTAPADVAGGRHSSSTKETKGPKGWRGQTKAGCDGGAETGGEGRLGEGLWRRLETPNHLSPALSLAPASHAERVGARLRCNP